MAKLLLCLLSLVIVSVCVYAEPGQRCATTLCAAVMCSYGEEPFRPPGQCCLKCRPAKPKEDCSLIRCKLPVCPEGQEHIYTPVDCCPVCRPVGAQFCFHNGKRFVEGTSFKIDCNTCTCMENGLIGCTEMACLATCKYKGVNLVEGETIKDDCNTCQCRDGDVACTTDVCKKPAHCEGVYCIMCVGITYPGECCPTCSTLPVA